MIAKLRYILLDGVLATLRALLDLMVTSLVCHGEGAIIVLATLHPDIRRQAYKERKVPESESRKLEEVGEA